MTEQEWLACADPLRMLTCLTVGDVAVVHPDSPGPHIEHLPRPRISDRKLRLFAIASTRFRHPQGFWEGRWADDLFVLNRAEQLAETGELCQPWNDRAYCHGLAALMSDSGLSAAQGVVGYCEERNINLPDLANLLRMIFGNPFRPIVVRRSGGSVGGQGLEDLDWQEPWLTPTVLAIANQAYEERPGRKCRECFGTGKLFVSMGTPYDPPDYEPCKICHGTGRIEDGRLDQGALNVLADALIDAGMPEMVEGDCDKCKGNLFLTVRVPKKIRFCEYCQATGKALNTPHPILAALRSDEAKYRGLWCLDLILGKE